MGIRQVQKVGVLLSVAVLCTALVVVVVCWPSSSSAARSAPAPVPVITLPYHVSVKNTPAAFSL